MAEQYREAKKQPARRQLILVRAPETGIPQYASAAGSYRKWIVFTIITAAAALAITLNIVFVIYKSPFGLLTKRSRS